MKNNLLCLVFLFASASCFAQFGVKAGLNFNSNGELREIVTAGENIIEDSGDSKIGYHIGAYYEFNFSKLYLRPEVVYTKTQSEYGSSNYDMSKIDVPVLLGLDIIGPLSIFAGPAFQYTLDNGLDDVNISDVENDFTVGFNFGAAVKFGNIGLDVRYERGFTENEASILDSNNVRIGTLDARPSQLIFSLSLKL
ncbi:outer membrane protein beta-barrel domain protein [Kordia sp. SMS9]|uniref:outer membrane beta-barrel protein n=1 Tax=Kordia sp. SMS9 TaxID=2282170 RepID=UPI000E0DA108|nr:outer membrane beta-barrel protein [Kordia sp. SMS9]AXG70865.1 outer membrane protein beta-barrel domain protein [Kordia sp. SMS9]